MNSLLYQSGDLFFNREIRAFLETPLVGSYQEPFYLTYWSLLHFVSGILFALVSKSYVTGFVVHSAWELWQVYIGMNKPWNLSGHNGTVDIVTDTLLFMAGMMVTTHLWTFYSVLFSLSSSSSSYEFSEKVFLLNKVFPRAPKSISCIILNTSSFCTPSL